MIERNELRFYRARDGWRWRFVAAENGDILADSGQGYDEYRDCAHAAARVLYFYEPTLRQLEPNSRITVDEVDRDDFTLVRDDTEPSDEETAK